MIKNRYDLLYSGSLSLVIGNMYLERRIHE
ncbi:Uncharacterised protein [Staphylococcus aureus]|uniref:Uncharacterized protein n=1 Tax=Staphylococcus aureus TaxID=1280 RepID=A0A8G2HXB5_STAAU|nr:Uncharacterised protein [Staphylococcus aureus]SUK14549.1 Uncharacterised protein [Staphylococcus aureus]SUK44130.1 Uncharacterised protein [Staphylococcus aureus]SUK44674.1 Uncharacterised protein [Staphylococcus aureus]SUK53250.1 Uncharacterised protein [Staphylococcus aureus]